ncbi:MAG: aminotransferase class I/II-fold pyridoxal phosphate-dependent enzyme [Candidatus Euphemobacter frigidus]|nr:aminotransferase class I/II-fold pyridoxal phosphate-dependent enzyme [Candidatus Euphemobacter frigidus]MDP8274768.1 aminotransferase class I/II-fold pyridoxal phosphate-dependent enzyme [Candidatus Euphemobacter frigidus]
MKMKKITPARRTENITYAVRDVIVLADQVARQGKEMTYLNIGDPNIFDFETSPEIIEVVYRAMKDNHNGYAPSSGIEEARQAITRSSLSKGISGIRDVFVTTGASEAIDICLTALLNQGENVLIPSPGYPLYNAIVYKLNGEPRPYCLDEENGWQPDINDIAARIDEKTRAIVIINPNNPTGCIYREDTLRRIIDLALEHNLVIFSDEIYDNLTLEGEEHIATASLSEEAPVITLNGLSKNYLAPGFRIGWGIVSGRPAALLDYLEAINKLLRARLSANHPIQWAIKAALEGEQDHLVEVREKLTRRRDITVEMLNAIPGITCVKPEGAFYAFPRLEIAGSDERFAQELIRETGVVVVPGSGFGQKPGTKHFRVVYLAPEEVLERAYRAIAGFIKKYKRA